MAFSDLEERKHKKFPENDTLARAPTLRKNPMEPPQEDHSLGSREQLLYVVMFVSVVITYYPLH